MNTTYKDLEKWTKHNPKKPIAILGSEHKAWLMQKYRDRAYRLAGEWFILESPEGA
jgi:hypothetical protein